ncbi:MAG: UDP-N-acetylmuramate dehydrogenase [Treponema sp.]|jgi:UDP-N-acetylmuramate dehydrogenase|nr:UDP-N-acetylmuramate dehydrogenase [Treponema sp.]
MAFNQGRLRHIIDACLGENPCDAEIRFDEPMAAHTTFNVGGPADCWVRPGPAGFPAFSAALAQAARSECIPFFVLGGGANIVVADRGIRGFVLDTSSWAGLVDSGGSGCHTLRFRSGTELDRAADIAASAGLSGLEFVAGMPGTIGGAVWMNARCYGHDIAGVLAETETVDFSGPEPERKICPARPGDFSYKRSPFQTLDALILGAAFRLTAGDEKKIRATMDGYRRDREAKGHYRCPSAGSAFKNNHAFGKPSGQIIDELGLRSLQNGRAQVAPWHGNIIINTGGARASDVRLLLDEVAARVRSAAGFVLEPEILFVGDWPD